MDDREEETLVIIGSDDENDGDFPPKSQKGQKKKKYELKRQVEAIECMHYVTFLAHFIPYPISLAVAFVC